MRCFIIFLFLLSTLFSRTQFETYPTEKPRLLVGYRMTTELKPRIWVKMFKSKNNIIKSYLVLDVKGAKKMMISNYPDFRKAKWRPYTKVINWKISHDKKINTVYAVFAKKDQKDGLLKISRIVDYTIDKNDFSRVLEKKKFGYIDWSKGNLQIESIKKEIISLSNHKKIHLIRNRIEQESQRNLTILGNDMMMDLRISPTYTLRNKIILEKKSINNLRMVLKDIRLIDSIVSTEKENPQVLIAKATAFLSFTQEKKEGFLKKRRDGESTKKSCLYHYAKKTWEKPKTKEKSQDGFSSLVIDLRGFDYPPSMFPKVKNEQLEPILNGSLYENCTTPFVRFVHSLKGIALPKKTMFTKAYKVPKNNLDIILSQKYAQSLTSSKENLKKIANGNFWILID